MPSQSGLLQAAEEDENNSSDDDDDDVEDQEDIEASDDSDEDEEIEPAVVGRAEGVASEVVIEDKVVRNTSVIIQEFDYLFLLLICSCLKNVAVFQSKPVFKKFK